MVKDSYPAHRTHPLAPSLEKRRGRKSLSFLESAAADRVSSQSFWC